MKLASSTGDFWWYVTTLEDTIKCFKDTKFKNINLEITKNNDLLMEDSDNYLALVDKLIAVREETGLNYAVAHAPCLHFPIPDVLKNKDNEEFKNNIRAINRSIEICHKLGINRIVVHSCANNTFTEDEFFKYNQIFYNELFPIAEKYNIMLLTENWDNNGTHFSTGEEMRRFIDKINHPLLCACWDTAHGNICPKAREIGQYDNIIALGDKLKGMHVSDNFGDCHHHSWPFAGIINFDSVMQGLLDVNYDGYFTFEASYSLLHRHNIPHYRPHWEHNGKIIRTLQSPSLDLKKKATDLLYETGKYILETYNCFEE